MEKKSEQEKKVVHRKTNWKLIGEIMQGFWRYLIAGSIFALIAVAVRYAVPFVTSFTLDFVIKGVDTDMPAFLARWLDALGGREYMRSHLYLCSIALVLFTMGNGLFVFFRRREIAFASEGIAKRLRDRLYRHLEDVPYDYHKHVSTGDLVQRCTSDVDTIRRFISVQMMEIIRAVSMMVIAMVIMFKINVPMAFYSIVTLPFLLGTSFVYFKYVRRYFTKSDEAEGALSTMIQEDLTGIRVVRAFGRQKTQIEKFTELNVDFRDKTYKLIKLLSFYWGFTDAVGFMQSAFTLIMGVYFVANSDFTLGNVMLFTSYTGMLVWPVRQLGRILADLGKALVSLGRIDEILEVPVEKEPGKALKPDLSGDIVFDKVCFGYDTYDDVLKDVSFTAHRGETIAILGSTGSGKSSLVQLMQRLYVCTAGEITINGTNINDIDHGHLRRNIGIVLQEPFLYSRTILENIRIVNPSATEEEVHEVARTASVHDVIESFENGYDTIVGERGVTLSGGQQQRVAIARTLMQRAPILIFDDSMSAVDTETDASIRASLANLSHDGITFIISHRITTLCEADKILVLEHGRLVQEGTHHELLHQEGLYSRIAAIQDMAHEGGEQA